MRQADLRTLATRGIEIQSSPKIQGLEVYEALDGRGLRLLIFCGGALGPNWVSIAYLLEQQGQKYSLLDLGKTFLVSPDTHELRLLLSQVMQLTRASAQEEVFVQDVGFLTSDLPKKFDPRPLIAPAVILIITAMIWFLQFLRPLAQVENIEPTIEINCALDLTESEFQSWFNNKVENGNTEGSELVIQSDLGLLILQIEQSLGSTQLVNARIECQDGRAQDYRFRTDSQRGGDLVELGEKLDP